MFISALRYRGWGEEVGGCKSACFGLKRNKEILRIAKEQGENTNKHVEGTG